MDDEIDNAIAEMKDLAKMDYIRRDPNDLEDEE
jgi:hypothetical protein